MIHRILISFILLSSVGYSSEYDVSTLAKRQDIEQLINYFHNLRFNYTAVPEKDKRLDKELEAKYWMSQNKHLKEYCERFFRETPHTVSTSSERAEMLFLLANLTAEWSVRLLFEEVMINRKGQDVAGVNKPLNEWEDWEIEYAMETGQFLRNDERAASKIDKLKLSEAPVAYLGGIGPKEIKALRVWYPKNKHRLDEVVVATWGKYAVTDEYMASLGKKPEKASSPKPDTKSQPDKVNNEPENIESRWPFIVGALIFITALGFWMKAR